MDQHDAPAEFLTTFLAGRNAACPGCGYNLRDLQGTRRPECGDILVLRVGLVEPKQAAPIAGLIGLAAGAGLNGLLLLYIAIQAAIVRATFTDIATFPRHQFDRLHCASRRDGAVAAQVALDPPTAGRPAVGVGERLLGVDAGEPDRLRTQRPLAGPAAVP